MRRILIPTDFSPIADNALSYAIALASGWRSELHLYHIFLMSKFDYDRNAADDDQPMLRHLERCMNATKTRFGSQINEHHLTVRTTVEESDACTLFTERVRQYKFDLVVMGSKGASGIRKVVFGSFAANAIEWSRIPVWIVPPAASYTPVKHIAIATDQGEVTPGLMSILKILSERHLIKVTMITVHQGTTSPTQTNIDFQLPGVECIYLKIPLKESVNYTISEFIDQHDIDLLCMIRRDKGLFSRLFKTSITRNQALSGRTPLLIVPETYKMQRNSSTNW